MKYWTGSHTKHRLVYHIVWIPKYRKRILKGRITERVRELLEKCAEINKWEIHEIKIKIDHVHMIIQLRTDMSVSEVVKIFKGGSSKVIREEFSELEEFLWGDSFWADGYFAETVGQVDEEKIREYVRSQ